MCFDIAAKKLHFCSSRNSPLAQLFLFLCHSAGFELSHLVSSRLASPGCPSVCTQRITTPSLQGWNASLPVCLARCTRKAHGHYITNSTAHCVFRRREYAIYRTWNQTARLIRNGQPWREFAWVLSSSVRLPLARSLWIHYLHDRRLLQFIEFPEVASL